MAKISVLGAGSWGTALSILLYNNGHEVILWSALGEEITTLREKREHVSKLPGVKIPEPIDITIDLERSLRDADVAILQFLRLELSPMAGINFIFCIAKPLQRQIRQIFSR